MTEDKRSQQVQEKFPLRQIRLDMCECEHDDSDHQTEMQDTGVEDGACSICVCKKFTLKQKPEEKRTYGEFG